LLVPRIIGGNISPVLFQDGVRVLDKHDIAVLLEIGPHPVLSNLAKSSLSKKETVILPSSMRGDQNGKVINESIGRLFALGFSMDGNVYPGNKLQAKPREQSQSYSKEHIIPNCRTGNKGIPKAIRTRKKRYYVPGE
jgi:acyl transferase domain-containing protein